MRIRLAARHFSLALSLLGCAFGCQHQPEGPAAEPPKKVEAPIATVDQFGLVPFFNQNEVHAVDWLKSHRISISAPVYDLVSPPDPKDGCGIIIQAVREENRGSASILFEFPEKFRKYVGELRAGSMVTCVGSYRTGSSTSDIIFDGESLHIDKP